MTVTINKQNHNNTTKPGGGGGGGRGGGGGEIQRDTTETERDNSQLEMDLNVKYTFQKASRKSCQTIPNSEP